MIKGKKKSQWFLERRVNKNKKDVTHMHTHTNSHGNIKDTENNVTTMGGRLWKT